MSERRHPAQSTSPAPDHWPKGVLPVSLGGLDNLGVDGDGRLYWNGKQMEVRQRLRLSRTQGVVALVATIAAVSMAVFDALRYFAGQ